MGTKSFLRTPIGDDDEMSIDPDFEELVKLYYRDLYRFGFSLSGNDADACD